jgi:hypothetical protein
LPRRARLVEARLVREIDADNVCGLLDVCDKFGGGAVAAAAGAPAPAPTGSLLADAWRLADAAVLPRGGAEASARVCARVADELRRGPAPAPPSEQDQ